MPRSRVKKRGEERRGETQSCSIRATDLFPRNDQTLVFMLPRGFVITLDKAEK